MGQEWEVHLFVCVFVESCQSQSCALQLCNEHPQDKEVASCLLSLLNCPFFAYGFELTPYDISDKTDNSVACIDPPPEAIGKLQNHFKCANRII